MTGDLEIDSDARADQRRHRAVLAVHGALRRQRPPRHAGLVGADPRRPLDAAVVEGVELAAVHHERLAVEQPLVIHAVQEAQALAPLVGGERRRDDTVVDHHTVRVGRIAEAVVVDEGVHHERAGPAAPVVDQPGVGNLVVGVAIAVGVLIAECLQHGTQLCGGGGHLQAEHSSHSTLIHSFCDSVE